MTAIYHITSAGQAEQATRVDGYVPNEFEADGFIHCSYAHQVTGVANFKYRARQGLVLLEIDRSRVPCKVVDENLDGGDQLFPRIYGHLPMSAVVAVHDFSCEEDGHFELPPTVRRYLVAADGAARCG